jgi:hypothetical protein
MPAPTKLNNDAGSVQKSGQYTETSGQESVTLIRPDSSGSSSAENLSYDQKADLHGNVQQMNSSGMSFKTPADMGFFAGLNYFESIAGDRQSVHGGDNHDLTHGDKTSQGGHATPKAVEAAQKLQQATHEIDKKKIDTIKNTKGSEVECPTCLTEVLTDRGQCLLDEAIKIIRLAIPNFPYPLDVLEKILNFLGIPMSTPQKTKELNGGKGCGSPGCKNGMVSSPQSAVQQANQQAADQLQSQQKQLEKYQKDSGSGGSHAVGPFMGDVSLQVGAPGAMNVAPTCALTTEDVIPFRFEKAKSTGELIPNSRGNCKKAVHSDPLINTGSLFVGVNQKFTLSVGSPGIHVMTTGKLDMNGSSTTISAVEGELNLISSNKTTIAGGNVIIDANNRSGSSGVHIDGDTYIKGSLSVTGDVAHKGSFMIDGGLHCHHITAPGERVSSGPSGAAHQVDLNAHWNNPITGMQATVYEKYDTSYKKISRDIFNFLSLNIANGMAEIKTLIEETYAGSILLSTVDNNWQPTGFAYACNATPPGSPGGPPLLVNGVAGINITYGTSAGYWPVVFYNTFVVPGQVLPVRTFTHNHGSAGGNHAHDFTSLPVTYVGTNQASRLTRPDPSSVPTPGKTQGVGTKPGHKNTGSLCIPCINPFGGGGNNNRNAAYGLPPDDGNGYPNGEVPVVGKFDDNGNLVPPPSIDLGCNG